MEREILFRGKRKDNGEWVEGNFQHYPFNDTWTVIVSYDPPDSSGIGQAHYTDVDLSTVGQYTGLTDKNGKRIFEGDILRIAKKMDGLGNYFSPPLKYPVNVIVEWDLCAWLWETITECKYYITFPDAWCHYECEVIGNIHDNPELLEATE